MIEHSLPSCAIRGCTNAAVSVTSGSPRCDTHSMARGPAVKRVALGAPLAIKQIGSNRNG
jgi:hypothetical protein